jgi:hypothetical protein
LGGVKDYLIKRGSVEEEIEARNAKEEGRAIELVRDWVS